MRAKDSKHALRVLMRGIWVLVALSFFFALVAGQQAIRLRLIRETMAKMPEFTSQQMSRLQMAGRNGALAEPPSTDYVNLIDASIDRGSGQMRWVKVTEDLGTLFIGCIGLALSGGVALYVYLMVGSFLKGDGASEVAEETLKA